MNGAGKIDTKRLMADIEANNAKLNACPRHFFGLTDEDIAKGVGYMIGQKVTCQRCGGQLRLTDVNQYVRGFAAAGGNPNDVLPGWNDDTSEGRNERAYFGKDRAD